MKHPVFARYLLCCVRIGLDWIQLLGHQLDWTGIGSVARGFGLDWIISTQSISYSGPQGTASLPVPKQASDSPNPINWNSTSFSTSTTHGSLTRSMRRRLSCSRCRKPWTSIVFVVLVCLLSRYVSSHFTTESPRWDIKCKNTQNADSSHLRHL